MKKHNFVSLLLALAVAAGAMSGCAATIRYTDEYVAPKSSSSDTAGNDGSSASAGGEESSQPDESSEESSNASESSEESSQPDESSEESSDASESSEESSDASESSEESSDASESSEESSDASESSEESSQPDESSEDSSQPDESSEEAVSGAKITFVKPEKWEGTIYAYVYEDGGEGKNAEWPGEAMTDNGDGSYSYVVPSDLANPLVIFNSSESKKQYPRSRGLSVVDGKTYDNETTD